jgi:hypothetical protein
MEFVGLARRLRDSLSRPATTANLAIERLLRPLRPRPRFTPMVKFVQLRDIAKKWRELPGHGRLGFLSDFRDGRLRLAEIRCVPARMRFGHWDGDETELAVALIIRTVRSSPPAFSEERILIADIGFHALARRYERGVNRSDSAVLQGLLPIAHQYRAITALPGEFAVAVEGGSWRGLVSLVAGQPTATIRTYVDRA